MNLLVLASNGIGFLESWFIKWRAGRKPASSKLTDNFSAFSGETSEDLSE